jgi:hypothetical protein
LFSPFSLIAWLISLMIAWVAPPLIWLHSEF